jgi:hypothetical protein
MARSLSPEFRLIAACATWPPSDRRREAIRAATGRRLDWIRCVRVARRHQVIGLLHEGLSDARLKVPLKVAEQIGAQAAMLVRENLASARESLRLQHLFDDAGLPVLFVKGATLAMRRCRRRSRLSCAPAIPAMIRHLTSVMRSYNY